MAQLKHGSKVKLADGRVGLVSALGTEDGPNVIEVRLVGGGVCYSDANYVTLVRRPGRPAKYASQAERQAAYRARNDLVQVAVELPADVAQALDAYMARHSADGEGLSKSAVIAKLLRTQLLRKR